MQALSQQNSSEFGGTCGGNYFYLTNVAYGGFGCKSRMAYNIKGDEQAKAFLAANSQSLDLGFPSYIVGIHAGSSEMAGRAVVKGPTGQCSMMTLLGVVVQGISQAQINSKLQAFYNSTAKQQQDRVYGAILKN